MHEPLIDKLRATPHVQVETHDWSWHVQLPDRSGFRFEVIVPKSVLEWFATAYDTTTGKELWSDWTASYSFKGGRSDAELPGLFAREIEYFISRLISADAYRISQVPGPRIFGIRLKPLARLEARITGTWQEIMMGDLPAA